jgi:hypothetical protein
MSFPSEKNCPRIVLSSEIKLEAEPYIYKSTIRGLYDEKHIEDYPSFCDLLDPRSVGNLSFSAQLRFKELLPDKTLGLHGEIAFNICRGLDYHAAFEVAKSYVYHSIEVKKTHKRLYPYVYPDACLDSSCSVKSRCSGSKTIDVKTHGRPDCIKHLGLGIANAWWLSHAGRYDDFYVAVSERCEHNASYGTDGKRTYKVIDYAILGYAIQKEVDDVTPNPWHWRNIHFDKLHPIDCLTPSDYETSETVGEREKPGYL